MAFTSRAMRQTSFHKNSTPHEVGPGSYDSGRGRSEQIRGRAPFSSTAERSLTSGQAVWVTPGPGAYGTKASMNVGKASASSNSFVNKVARFVSTGPEKEMINTPGPGSYNVSEDVRSQWITNGSGHVKQPPPALRGQSMGPSNPNQSSSVVWFKKPSPPSIPTHAQSYGYEQASDGQLTRQPAPPRGYTGKAHDSAGPGSYDPNTSSLGKRATGWALSKVQRKFIQENKVPGPGEYHKDLAPDASTNSTDKSASTLNVSAGTCNFKSKVSRGLGVQEDPKGASAVRTPGPGSYNAQSSFKVPQVPENLQFFGTTSRRSFEVEPSQYAASFQWKTPGPGAYEERRQTFRGGRAGGRAQAGPALRVGAAPKAGFDSRERRFKSAGSFAPGPGAYDEKNTQGTLVRGIENKTHARNGIFGSSEPNRFFGSQLHKPEGAKALNLPGPGSYEVAASGDGGAGSKATGRRRRPKQSSAFKSATQRFSASAPARGKSLPAPGDYDVVPRWAGQETERLTLLERDVFISAAQRFPNKEVCPGTTNMLTPGPGSYDPAAVNPSNVDPRHMGLAALEGRSTMPMTRRFASETPARDKLAVPGPGSYNAANPAHTFVRRSYNITIDL